MKIEYDQIKRYLEVLESSELPVINTINIFKGLELNENKLEDCNHAIFYLNLLKDQDLLECVSDNDLDKENLGFSYTGNSDVIINILNFRLTILGHQTLESLRNKQIWNKVKEPLSKLGIEGLKQIPALALNLLIQ